MSQPALNNSDERLESLLQRYKEDPQPIHLRSVVDELEPTIRYTLLSLNADGDPVLTNQAKLFAAQAVKSYDPKKGASLKTYVSQQLKQMHRYARKVKEPLAIPERSVWEKNALYRHEQEFIEAHGREPSLQELSDWSAISRKRIEQLRAIPYSSSEGKASGGDVNNALDIGSEEPDFLFEAMDYVYRDSTPSDQKIFEYMTGFGGVEQLEPKEVSQKLNISESQISRRFAKMLSQVQDIDNDLQKLNLSSGGDNVGE